MKPINAKVSAALEVMLKEGSRISTGAVARRAGVSAPTAYIALRAMAEAGTLEHVGGGRTAHFRPVQPLLAKITEPREGLSESDIWARVALLPAIKKLRGNVRDVMHIGLTEIVNNAIDHSLGNIVEISLFHSDGAIAFEVRDDGVGIFETVMRKVGLKTPFEAIAELQKGKVTTMPDLHSGEGIFFTSKMADRMSIESHGVRWLIDNVDTNDQSVGQVSPATEGTRVRFRIALGSNRLAEEVYNAFTSGEHPQAFTKTRAAIKLFREGNRIVSRSEAKRLVVGLEKFREVEMDFSGIEGIGQGFADEVFRVWQREHADTHLIVTHANRAVRFMIDRARASSQATRAITPDPAAVRLTVGAPTVVVAPAPTVSGAGGSTFTFAATGQGRVEEPADAEEDQTDNGGQAG